MYTLTANIEDMSRTEARALLRAILEKHGNELVEEEMKRRVEHIEAAQFSEVTAVARHASALNVP